MSDVSDFAKGIRKMSASEWRVSVERLEGLLGQSANAAGIKCGEFEGDIGDVEAQIEIMCDQMEANSIHDLLETLIMVRDIATLEPLAPLRSKVMIDLLGKAIDWSSSAQIVVRAALT